MPEGLLAGALHSPVVKAVYLEVLVCGRLRQLRGGQPPGEAELGSLGPGGAGRKGSAQGPGGGGGAGRGVMQGREGQLPE